MKPISIPASAFICDQNLGTAKVSDPNPFQGLLKMVSSLSWNDRCSLVLGGFIHKAQHRHLGVTDLEPKDVALKSFVELLGLGHSRWGYSIRFPVSSTGHTFVLASTLDDHVARTTTFQHLGECLWRRMAKSTM